MNTPPNVLDYEPPLPRRPLRDWFTPANFAYVAFASALLALIAGPITGSGVIRVNPVAQVWSGVAVACGLAYGLLRIWRSRDEGRARAAVFALALLVSLAAFAHARYAAWGYTRLPTMALRHEYWRSLLVSAVAVAAACAFSAGHALYRLRVNRRTARH